MTFDQKLSDLRRQAALSQEQLAEKLSVSRQAISRWENGEVLPDAPNLVAISKLFGVSIDYLLNEDFASDADTPAVQNAKARLQARHTLDTVRIITLGVVALGFVWEIAGWLMFMREWVMLLGITVQIIAAIVFKAMLVHLPVDEEYRQQVKRKMVFRLIVLTAWIPILLLARELWSFYPWPRFAFMEEISAFILYIAVCGVALHMTRKP